MDFETLKIIDYELEYCVRNGVPPKMGKSLTTLNPLPILLAQKCYLCLQYDL